MFNTSVIILETDFSSVYKYYYLFNIIIQSENVVLYAAIACLYKNLVKIIKYLFFIAVVRYITLIYNQMALNVGMIIIIIHYKQFNLY